MAARHEGIRKLPNGRYQARISITEHGTAKQISVGTFATVRDAKDARNLALAARHNQTWIDPRLGTLTAQEWIVQWRDLRRIPNTTRLRSFLKVHILPTFGARRLGDIEPLEVQQWVNRMTDNGLSPVTVQAVYALFKRALTAAVEFDRLAKNPCRGIVLPQIRRHRPKVLSIQQIVALEAAVTPRYRAMIHLAAWTGMRWGEVAPLRWENIDLTAKVIHIREAIKAETHEIGLPKNGHERTVGISDATVDLLTAHRRDFGGEGLLFRNRLGKVPNYGSFRKQVWYAALDTAGIALVDGKRIGFHALRHAYATHMVQYGLDPKVLSENLGHHSTAFTLDRYGSARSDLHVVTGDIVTRAMGETA